MNEWEKVTINSGSQTIEKTDRLNIPGGWLYRTTVTTHGYAPFVSVATTFVPFISLYDQAQQDDDNMVIDMVKEDPIVLVVLEEDEDAILAEDDDEIFPYFPLIPIDGDDADDFFPELDDPR